MDCHLPLHTGYGKSDEECIQHAGFRFYFDRDYGILIYIIFDAINRSNTIKSTKTLHEFSKYQNFTLSDAVLFLSLAFPSYNNF